jgi:hypothetical protein
MATAFAARSAAQESSKTYRIAYLGPSSASAPPQRAFFVALDKLGFVAGKNLTIDQRGFNQNPGQFPRAAALLVEAKPDVIGGCPRGSGRDENHPANRQFRRRCRRGPYPVNRSSRRQYDGN